MDNTEFKSKWDDLISTAVVLAREDDGTEEAEYLREFLVGVQKIHKLSRELRDHILHSVMVSDIGEDDLL